MNPVAGKRALLMAETLYLPTRGAYVLRSLRSAEIDKFRKVRRGALARCDPHAQLAHDDLRGGGGGPAAARGGPGQQQQQQQRLRHCR